MTVPPDIPPVPRVWTFGSGVEIRAALEPVIFIRGAEPRAETPEIEGKDDEPPHRPYVAPEVLTRQIMAATSSAYLTSAATMGGATVIFTQVPIPRGLPYTYVTFSTLSST